MEEWVDILSEKGDYTGERALKSEAHQRGLFHPTVHLWLYTRDGRILFQKRGQIKKTFPGLWDVSVSGHVSAGEAIVDAVIRETSEEIGLKIGASELQPVTIHKSKHVHRKDLRDFEFHHCFAAELKQPLNRLRKENEEVEELKLISLIQFANEVLGLADVSKYVPHGMVYYKKMISTIHAALKGSGKITGLA